MLQTGSTIPVSVAPLLELGLPLLRELVWPVFWLIVIFARRSDIRGLLSALIGLLNRVNSVKFKGLELGICPPEEAGTITQGVRENDVEIKRISLSEGVGLLPPEGVKIVRRAVREIERESGR
jgi:hypothetical protein